MLLLQNSTAPKSVVFPGSGRPSECRLNIIHSLPFISVQCFWELRCLSFHHSTQSHVILWFRCLSLPQFVLLLAHLSPSDAIHLSPLPTNHLLHLPLNTPMWRIIVGGPRVCISHRASAQWYFSIPDLGCCTRVFRRNFCFHCLPFYEMIEDSTWLWVLSC